MVGKFLHRRLLVSLTGNVRQKSRSRWREVPHRFDFFDLRLLFMFFGRARGVNGVGEMVLVFVAKSTIYKLTDKI